jgi:hypothetical protein
MSSDLGQEERIEKKYNLTPTVEDFTEDHADDHADVISLQTALESDDKQKPQLSKPAGQAEEPGVEADMRHQRRIEKEYNLTPTGEHFNEGHADVVSLQTLPVSDVKGLEPFTEDKGETSVDEAETPKRTKEEKGKGPRRDSVASREADSAYNASIKSETSTAIESEKEKKNKDFHRRKEKHRHKHLHGHHRHEHEHERHEDHAQPWIKHYQEPNRSPVANDWFELTLGYDEAIPLYLRREVVTELNKIASRAPRPVKYYDTAGEHTVRFLPPPPKLYKLLLKSLDRDVLVEMYGRHEEICDYRQAQNALKQGVVSQHKQIQDLKNRLERAEARCQDLGDQLSQAETSLRKWTAYGLARHREACVTRTRLFQEMTENANLGALLRKHWNELVLHSDALVQTIERSMLLEQVIADKDQMIRLYASELENTQDVRRQNADLKDVAGLP